MSLQMKTVEFQVPGANPGVAPALDGVTPAPVFSFDPANPDYKAPDADGIVRFTPADIVAATGGNLGLFDPDFGGGGSFADRFIHMLQIQTPGMGAAATVAVVDGRDPTHPGQEEILAPSPEANFWKDTCIFVPQGSDLAMAGFNAVPGTPVVVRINVVIWGSVEDYAHLLSQCCCENTEGGGAEPCCPPQVIAPQIGIPAQSGAELLLPAASCGLDEPITAQVLLDPTVPPPTGLPDVTAVTVTQGTDPDSDLVTVVLDAADTSGGFLLELTNACGCCTMVRFSVSPF